MHEVMRENWFPNKNILFHNFNGVSKFWFLSFKQSTSMKLYWGIQRVKF